MPKRSVFFISDGTGITAEALGHSLTAHFNSVTFREFRLPFIDNIDKAYEALLRIAAAEKEDGARAILVMTIVSEEIRGMFENSGALCIDLFGDSIKALADELGVAPVMDIGMARRNVSDEYRRRIDAINYTLGHDDGLTPAGLDEADVVLVGVSRSGKTPTCLYLAMQFGIRAANYPLIPEDLERMALPGNLIRYREKLFGLTIDPERLSRIRTERRPNSTYATIENCRKEIQAAQNLMRRENIAWLDSSSKSVEEIATMILQQIKPKTY